MYSLLLRGGLVVDGSGSPGILADVALQGNKIVAVAPQLSGQAAQVIDATGLVVAPGFIDLHSHTDRTILSHPTAASQLFQGITSAVVGNCGIGPFPVNPNTKQLLEEYLTKTEGSYGSISWVDCAGFARKIAEVKPTINILPLVAHGALRIAVMGTDHRPPDAKELRQMQDLLAANLSQGAWGLSTGLIYPPGSYAKTAELLALVQVLKPSKRIYASHIRNEEGGLLPAVHEAIHIARQSGVRTIVSHLKSVGRPNWGTAITALEALAAARNQGVAIWADQYPYTATSTTLLVLLPSWLPTGDTTLLLTQLDREEQSDLLVKAIDDNIALRGGADHIQIASLESKKNRPLGGLTLEAIATLWQTVPAKAVLQLLLEERCAVGGVFFSLGERDVETILKNPEVAVGSDGYGTDHLNPTDAFPHPRSYGTFPRFLGHYVRDGHLLSLEVAIRKMTSLPAHILGLTDRGLIAPGMVADLTLFDPATICDLATFAAPHQYPLGIPYVIVNGEIIVSLGQLTGQATGQVLRPSV
jgi:N-acyl-D-amino-acid deacylase